MIKYYLGTLHLDECDVPAIRKVGIHMVASDRIEKPGVKMTVYVNAGVDDGNLDEDDELKVAHRCVIDLSNKTIEGVEANNVEQVVEAVGNVVSGSYKGPICKSFNSDEIFSEWSIFELSDKEMEAWNGGVWEISHPQLDTVYKFRVEARFVDEDQTPKF